MEKQTKNLALICYIIPVLALVMIYNDKDAKEEIRNNYKRSSTMFLCFIALSLVFNFLKLPLGFILPIGYLILTFISCSALYDDDKFSLPIIDELGNKIFH